MPKVYKDSLWKGVIEQLFPEFFDYFFKKWKDQINLDKGFSFLDKKLLKLMPLADAKNRIADKLVKLYTRDGEEKWILIHIEVQGYEDKFFEERMFTYFYRIFDRYKVKIHALAILTDGNPNYLPDSYRYEFMGTSLTYSFDHYKLLSKTRKDFEGNKNNPFSIIMETAWLNLQTPDDNNLFNNNIRLVKRLFGLGLSKQKVEHILYFIKHYNQFKMEAKELELEETIELLKSGKKEPFGVIERIIVDLMETSKEELEEAKKEARQEARKEVMIEVKKNTIKQVEKAKQEASEGTLKQSIYNLLSEGFSPEDTARLLKASPALVQEVKKQHGL